MCYVPLSVEEMLNETVGVVGVVYVALGVCALD